VLYCVGALISGFNFYLSFIRYPLHQFRGGSRENLHRVSGIPVVGSLLLWMSVFFFPHEMKGLVWTALVVSLLDTGGIHWFIVLVILSRARFKNMS
jgi:hypothetical protein